MLSPLSGELIGPIAREVRLGKRVATARFVLLGDKDDNASLENTTAQTLDLLARTMVSFPGLSLAGSFEQKRREIGKLPAAVIQALLGCYLSAKVEPVVLLNSLVLDKEFRGQTKYDWQMLKAGLGGRPKPSPYLWAFCVAHLAEDRKEEAESRRHAAHYQAMIMSHAYHNPKELGNVIKKMEDPEAQTEAQTREEEDAFFLATDPIFGVKHEIDDDLLALFEQELAGNF